MSVSNGYSKDSSMTGTVLHRLWANGFPEAVNSPLAVNMNPTKYGEIVSSAVFSSIDFFAKALNSAPFDLAVNAYATRIVTEGNRVIGVQATNPDKQSFFLRAKSVILAASALQAPRLLMHSGIPGRAIGHYLTNHSMVIHVEWVMTPPHRLRIVMAKFTAYPVFTWRETASCLPLEPLWHKNSGLFVK